MEFISYDLMIFVILFTVKILVDITTLVTIRHLRNKDRGHLDNSLANWKQEFEFNVNRRFDEIKPEQFDKMIKLAEARMKEADSAQDAIKAKVKELEAELNLRAQERNNKDAEIKILELQLKLKEKEEFKLKQLVKLQEEKNAKSES